MSLSKICYVVNYAIRKPSQETVWVFARTKPRHVGWGPSPRKFAVGRDGLATCPVSGKSRLDGHSTKTQTLSLAILWAP
eukprot:scaffold1108_cov387-Prasinococcus_capsulatus_cf.AAC.5